MPIYFIDTIFPKGHKELNKKIVNLFTSDSSKVVINSNGFYSNSNMKDISLINLKLVKFKRRMLSIFFTQLINYLKIRFIIKDNVHEIKVFTTFECVSFVFAVLFFPKSKKIVFHHDNIDYLKIKYISFFFKLYMNKITHLVFADFIKEKLIEFGVKECNVFVVTHPIPAEETNINHYPSEKLYICLGYASDSEIFKEIIAYENTSKLLLTNGIRLIFRSQHFEYESESISIIRKHLSVQDYNDLFFRAKGVLLFYPKTFEYRFSGALLDAFRNKKNVIGTNIPIVRHFNSLYPDMCFYYNNIPELFEMLLTEQSDNSENYISFIQMHSDELIRNEFENIMRKI